MKQYITFVLVFFSTWAYSQAQCPGSAISSSKTAYCISDFVELIASGVPASTTIEWNLGQGWDTATSNYKIPAPAVGKLNIELRLTLKDGTVCDYEEKDLVTIHDLPQANFQVSRNLLCKVPDTLRIVDNTPNSYRRNWIINNKTLENTPTDITYQANSTGNYNITLVVKDTNGCLNAMVRNSVVRAYDDAGLHFTHTLSGNCKPVTANFKSVYTLNNQTLKSHLWTLPGSDKTTVTSKDVSGAKYTTEGIYNTSLKLTTNEGCIYNYGRSGLIRVGDTASLAVSIDKTSACLSERVTLTELKKPSPGNLKWNIGAANKVYPNKHEAELIFKDTGYFDLNLVYDYNSCLSTLNTSKIVYIEGLKADFYSDNALHCETPHTVELSNISDTIKGQTSTYSWRVINSATGSVLTTATSKHFSFKITQSPVVYDVELITRSSKGCNDTTAKTSFARIAPYQFDFYADPDVACVGQSIDFINNTPSASYYGLDLFSWDFLSKDKSKTLGASGSLAPSFTYPDTGYYPVQLTAANPLGCQEKYILDSAVQIVYPILDYNSEDSIVCLNDDFTLISRSFPVDERFINNYKFKHLQSGQEFTFSGDTVTASLSEIGEYEVVYNYSIDGGCNDSATHTLWVNGLKGKIELDKTEGCTPLVVNPTFKVEYNVHEGFADGDLNYYWDVVPRVGVLMNGTTTANPVFTLGQDREYSITLYVSNSSGCVNYVVSDPIRTGVDAKMTMSRTLGCIGDTIVLKDISTNNPTSVDWIVDRTSGYKIDKVDGQTAHFILLDTGDFDVSLVAKKGSLCSDTATQTIGVTKLKADFTVLDKSAKCAPQIIRFTNQSTNEDSLFWHFDDGTILKQETTDTINHNYLINSGPSGFDVMLVAKSNFGCTDTLIKPGSITLDGPVAKFDMWNHKGCEPVDAKFTNTSSGYSVFYFDYGDGSPIDTNKIVNRTYWNTATTILQQIQPTIRVVSADGCEATFTPDEPLEVYHNPQINLVIEPDTVVCQRQKIVVNDTGKYAYYWFYRLNNVQVSAKRKDTITIEDEGLNKLFLLAQNTYGCMDTVSQTIRTRESAKMEFIVPPYLCPNTPIQVKLSLENNTKPFRYIWDFGDPSNPNNTQTTSDSSAFITYTTPGKRILWVTAELPNGCSIPDSISLNVFDSDKTPEMDINFATYDTNNKVRLYYEDFDFDYLDFFNVFKDGNFLLNASKNPELNILDPNPDKTTKQCYSVSITDQCGVEADKSRSHCPVILQVATPAPKQVSLDWTYYVGWDRVEYYEIFRREKDNTQDTFTKVGEVFGTQKSFIDSSDLCNREYLYKVAAVRAGDSVKSYSNTEIIEPQFILYQNKLNVLNVSVLEDQSVSIRWESSSYEFNDHYKLRKFNGSQANYLEDFDVVDTTFVDANVQPSETAYLYTVAEVDYCDNIAQSGNYGKSILLKASYDEDHSILSWSLYEQWDYPVVSHHVEFVQPGNIFTIADLGPTVLNYDDYTLYQDVNGYFPYRVYAVNTNGDTSYSNIAKTSGEGIYHLPNSFSPNNDGINDVLGMYTLFITDEKPGDFKITIFNRWGEQVHQSTNINDIWDGTMNGKVLPTGLYMYNLRLTEGGGHQIHDYGTIYLAR